MTTQEKIETNPFIAGLTNGTFGTFDDAIPFDKILPEHYLPALQRGIAEAKKKLDAIKAEETPTFANTIIVLDTASDAMNAVLATYGNLFSAHCTQPLIDINEQIEMMSVEFSNEVLFDVDLFAKVKFVYDNEYDTLQGEDKRLLQETYEGFTTEGALLDSVLQERLAAINQEIALIEPKFAENARKATNAFSLTVDRREVLGEMPDMLVEAAAEEAKKRGLDGKYVFTLQAPSYGPFMKFCTDRALRQQIAEAYARRGVSGEFTNQDYIKQLVKLRLEKAKILGFETYADYVTSRRMAKNLATVQQFENTLIDVYSKHAEQEMATLKQYSHDKDEIELQAWDVAYYDNLYAKEHFDFSDELLRPYFQAEKALEGIFIHAQKLYNLVFEERDDIPVYHPEVKVYEVKTLQGEYIGLFYVDLYPREEKKEGAWMSSFREQGLYNGAIRRPHITIVCNFTKPTADSPALLTHREVETLFHEFGHSLHGLLSQCTYSSLSGTSVKWDFVELPSQVMENWCSEKEALDLFATHYQTGATIPQEYLDKMKEIKNYGVASFGLRQVKLGLLDLMYHSTTTGEIDNVVGAEHDLWSNRTYVPMIDGASTSCSFTHIFAGGYAAGYYSYKWAEVLDADAFELFKQKGIFNKDVADSFRKNILEKGNSEDPMELYVRFRGQQPDPMALHRREGLVE